MLSCFLRGQEMADKPATRESEPKTLRDILAELGFRPEPRQLGLPL